jgi:hypothetical protein
MFRRAFRVSVTAYSTTHRKMRRLTAAIVLGLALAVSACGIGSTGGGATPTPKPTATATPLPCTTWRIVSSPNSTKYPENGLAAVSALSPTSAWAVGSSFNDGGPVVSLIVQWDGSAWHVVSSPGNDGLSGVAAIAPNDVWAAGSLSSHQPHPTTLIEHWNGSQWSIVTSPNPGPLSDTLSAVAAVAANDVWAVGESVTGNNATQPLIERWDGAAWHVVSSSVPAGATASSLNAVTRVPETNQLWAVGSVRIGTPPSGMLGYFQPLVERWDGSSWQVITSPSLPSGSLAGSLNGVVALSTTDAWAVGDYTTSDHKLRALITHWDGSAWKMVTSPDAVGSLSVVSLGTVAAANAQDVRVVGHTNTGNGQNVSLIAQWNGDTWQDATSPVPSGAIDSGLGGIASDGAGNFWAVGSYRDTATTEKTLTLHCP